MKTCAEVRETFSDRVDGTLAPPGQAELDRHLLDCPDCARVWHRFRESLDSLREAAPSPSEGMVERVRDAIARERHLREASRERRRTGWRWAWAPLAAAVLVALAFVVLKGRGPAPPVLATAAPGCAESLFSLWRVDVAGLRAPEPTRVSVVALDLGGARIAVPAALLSRGPYAAATDQAIRAGHTTCVPLLAAYGDVLVLSVADTRAGDASEIGFQTAADARRVFYTRVAWTRAGRLWRLEGRAPAGDLLALAREIEAKSQGSSVSVANASARSSPI